MKVFREEDNQEVAYVDIRDIILLINSGYEIDANIFMDDNNKQFLRKSNGLVRVSDRSIVNLLKDTEFILDYDVCVSLSDEEINDDIIFCKERMEEISRDYHNHSSEDRMELLKSFSFLDHKLNSLMVFLLNKDNCNYMNIEKFKVFKKST